MKKLILIGCLSVCVFTSMISAKKAHADKASYTNMNSAFSNSTNNAEVNYWIDSLYTGMHLNDEGLSREAFFNACKGYEYLLSENEIQKPGIITICDFSQRSDKRRLYVLDLNKEKVLFNTYVAHGHNSGDDFAVNFSNDVNSNESCLGFMLTAETYIGDNGFSMRLDGIENGINDNVRTRAIVMHGSDYVSKQRARNGMMMGRSFGCPAVPAAEVKKIVNCIKGGSCFFNFYPDKAYAENSKILNANFIWPAIQSMQLADVKIPDSLKNLYRDPLN